MSQTPIRVVIADDSALLQKSLQKVIANFSELELLATASDGVEAVAFVKKHQPDVLVLDVEMPNLDGIGVLKALKENKTDCKVIIFSSKDHTHADKTIECLELGAYDFISKPRGGGLVESLQTIEEHLIPRVLSLRGLTDQKATPQKVVTRSTSAQTQVPPQALFIASSTGGPDALMTLIPTFKDDFPLPIIIVQHMPPVFTTSLAERLNQLSPLNVVEATKDMPIEKGNVYIAPGGYHLFVKKEKKSPAYFALSKSELLNGCRPAADYFLFKSAESYLKGLLITVLTGMGSDGTEGCRSVLDHGVHIVAQSEESCLIYGMPKAIVENGLANKILDLERISAYIKQYITK